MATFSSGTMGRYTGFWLIVTAFIELVLAAVFIGIGLSVPVVDFGMFLTAAILGITGIVLLLIGLRVRSSAAANERLLREGVAGTATVTGLTQTGMYLNENPQVAVDMLVDVPGRQPYPVTRKEFVPLILLGRLSSGAPLPVRVDPSNPQRVVIDWQNASFTSGLNTPVFVTGVPGAQLAGSPMVDAAETPPAVSVAPAPMPAAAAATTASVAQPVPTAGLPFGLKAEMPPEAAQQMATMRAWLRQTGMPGTARIDDATDTGILVGTERLFTVEATLELPGRAPEKLPPVAVLVAPENVDKLRVGYRVPVRVAPDNHQLIDFAW